MAFGRFGARGGFGGLGIISAANIPSWVPNHNNPPDFAINWQTNQVWQKTVKGLVTPSTFGVATVRASAATDLLYTSASGYAYNTFSSNVTVSSPGVGRLTFEARTNLFLVPTVPATQTITLSATGNYTLWCNGSGSAAIAAGTATITGAGTSTNGTPVTINCTVTGTVVVTITGSLQAAQLEAGSFPTSFIAAGTRAADVTSATLSFGSAYTLFEMATPHAPITFATAQVNLSIDDGTTNNRAFLARAASTAVFAPNMISGAASEWGSTSAAAWAQNASGIVAASFVSGAQNGYFNGVSNIAGTGATMPVSPTKLHFGVRADGTTGFFDGFVAKDAVWLSQAISNAQLQALQ